MRTDSAFDQQDIGREGVATGRRCLGLPCFILQAVVNGSPFQTAYAKVGSG